MNALIYLVYRQAANSLKHTLGSAKRLIPVLLMVFVVGQSVVVNCLMPRDAERARAFGYVFHNLQSDIIWSIVFGLLALKMFSVVDSAFSEGKLGFLPAHVDFLFPSPINRRLVLAMKLLGDCARYILFTAFFYAWVSPNAYHEFGTKIFPSMWISIAAIVMLVVFFMNITHTLNIAASVGAQRLGLLKGSARLIMAAIAAAAMMVAVVHYAQTGDVVSSLIAAARSGLVRTVLAPISWCTNIIVGPIIGVNYGNLGLQALGLVVLAVISFIAVMARPENLYEPSLSASARLSRIAQARRSGSWAAIRTEMRREKINKTAKQSPVPPFGRGAWALLWKMLVVQMRTSSWTLVLGLVLPPTVAFLAARFMNDNEILRYSSCIIPYVTWMLIGSCVAGLKSEFRQAETLKTLPDKASRIVAVQVIGQWMKILFFVAMMSWSLVMFVRKIDVYLLTILSISSVTVGFAGVTIASVLASLYPDSRDKLAMTIPGCLANAAVFGILIPTGVIAGLAIYFHANLLLTSALLIIVNALISWGLLVIASSAFRNADPNEG